MSPSARNLILANVGTLVLAIVFEWELGWLMWPYWIQSVVIGYYAWRRMMGLDRFSSAGLVFNDKPVAEDARGKRNVAWFFAFHYGIFHFVYLIFLLIQHRTNAPLDWLVLLACGLSFIVSQRSTYTVQHAADLRGKPRIGMIMFQPYLRVVPMHLAILFADGNSGGVVVLTGFVVLKTLADLGLDYIDRRAAERGAHTPTD